MTSTWTEFRATEPDFADAVRRRFEKYVHHVLATVRKDGSPRLTGLQVAFLDGELWLGMMPNSRKAQDLRRDPRFAVQANPGGDEQMADGDARISGRAVEVGDERTIDRFVDEVGAARPFHLFRAEPEEVVETRVEGEELVVRVWVPGRSLRTVRRGNGDAPAREDD